MPCPHAGSIRRAWEAHWHVLAPEQRLLGTQRGKWTLQTIRRAWEARRHVLAPEQRLLETQLKKWTLVVIALYDNKSNLEFNGPEFRFTMDIRLILRLDEPGHAGTTSVLSPQWTDLSMINTWLKRCDNEHGQKCERPDWMHLRPEPIAMPEWLVDVVDYCMVECPADTTRYVALSYTWGGVQGLKHTSENIEELKGKKSLHPDKRSDIPRTVRDAFEITKLLGERYLWVDSLCIAQGEQSAIRGLNSMHHIYANSTLCLIAFTGTDANHGLRGIQGVSEPRHVEQAIYDMADGERFSCMPDSCKSIHDKQPDVKKGLRYTERGWTYQEYVFAKRRLIFTDGLLHWTCQCADWGEEAHGNLRNTSPTELRAASTFWMTSTGPNLELVEIAASGSDFDTRCFTHQEDVVKAFLGIQNHISRDFAGGFNYGHPHIFFDISLLWRVPRYIEKSKRRFGGIANSDPPSWSWMGWQGKFWFEKDEEYMMVGLSGVGFTQSVAQWYTMRNSLVPVLDLKPVNCQWQMHRDAAKNSSAHVPSGWQKVPWNGWDAEYCYRRESADGLGGLDNNAEIGGGYIGGFKYPIPLPAYTEICTSVEQRPFLYTRTTRSFFMAKPRVQSWRPSDCIYPYDLFCHDGDGAGLLWLHDELDEPCFQVEVVAVVKGWTELLSEYSSFFQAPGHPDSENYVDPARRHDCYFVLCVKWENGIAKRLGTGMVEANTWERSQEPVELILG